MNKEQIKNRAYNQCPFDHRCEKECTKWAILEQVNEDQLQIKPCPCAEKVERHYRYFTANIEPEYWDFTVDSIDEDFDQSIIDDYVSVFINKTSACVVNKVSILFHGSSGSGTTSIAVIILKHCLDAGYKGRIFTATEIINKLYGAKISDLYDYDILVIDGIDRLNKDMLKQDFSLAMADLMEKKAVVFTSLVPPHKLHGYHQDFINRISNIPNVKFKDINFREAMASKFDSVKES